jgi:signal peptidase II
MTKKVFLLIVLDQITKLIFSPRDFFVGPVHIHSMKNYGLSFGLNFGPAVNLILILLGVIFFGYYYWRHRMELSRVENLAFIFILAGAISNILDRVYYGYVRDFLDLGWGFTFNMADALVVIGLVLFLIFYKNGDKALN